MLSFKDYQKKIRACFLGKAIGGTLGYPVEGQTTTHNMTYYDPVPTEMFPNDDLDLQVVWLETIYEKGLPINRKHLAEGWLKHIEYHFDEYGIALRNLRNGMQPPLSGYYNNRMYAGMGSAIRAELWSSLAPANPELAAQFAREDACVDHFSDGVDATVFVAAMESAAYYESDISKLIETGLSFIDSDCKIARAVTDTIKWHRENDDMFAVRELILNKYGKTEWEKGNINWTDVTVNIAFTVLALLCGNKDFSYSICCAANLGYDTDCTAGIAASVLAIIDPDCIDEKWVRPIGTDVEVAYLLVGMHNKHTINDFCSMIDDLSVAVQHYYGTGIFENEVSGFDKYWTKHYSKLPLCKDYNVNEALISLEPIAVRLTYPEGTVVNTGVKTKLSARLINTSDTALKGKVELSVPDIWNIAPRKFDISLDAGEDTEIEFFVTAEADKYVAYYNTLQFRFSVSGIAFSAEANLPLGVPWRFKEVETLPDFADESLLKDAELKYAEGYILNIPKGKKFVAVVDFKLSHFFEGNDNFIAHGVPLSLYIDGKKILQHENEFYTPSSHRFECTAVYELLGGWHRAYIAADNELCNSDELYFAVANMNGRSYYNNIEWKIPVIE